MAECTCKNTRMRTTFDPACPFHGEKGSMVGEARYRPDVTPADQAHNDALNRGLIAEQHKATNLELLAALKAVEEENECLRETLRKIAESGILGYSQYRDLAWAALEAERG